MKNKGYQKYRVGSLFAGVGGICQAFRQAGCDVVWANEIDPSACITYQYKKNNKNTKLIRKDIRDIERKDLQGVDILTAGFPCQPFSQAGHGKGFDDDRSQLFFEVPRLLRKLKPKAFFLENVRNLATHNGGESIKEVCRHIREAGYSFVPFILKALDHAGIPQNRERLYMIGFRGERDFFYDTPVKYNDKKRQRSPLSSSFDIPSGKVHPCKTIKDFIDQEDSKSHAFWYKDKNNHIHTKVIGVAKDADTVYQYRRHYVRTNMSNQCPTLTANMGAGGHNVPIILDGKHPRRLTPKECFNFQGFDKNFDLPYDLVAKGQLYKQAGNAVVVPLVKKIALEQIRVLRGNS